MSTSQQPALGYVLKGYPRISETFISNEILLLEKLGFRMHLFSMRKPREPFSHDSVKQIKAAVNYLPTDLLTELPRLIAPNVLCAIRSPGRYRATLALASHRYRRRRKIATFKHLFQGGYLAEKLLRKLPHILHLHGHFAHSPTSVTMFASHLSGLPFSFTAHAKDIYTSDPDQLREKIDQATFVTTCTKHNQHNLQQIAPTSKTPIHCIFHGIDLTLFENKPDISNSRLPYQLLTVARIIEKKGLPTVYRALKILAEKNIRFHHSLIGDGEDKEKIRDLIAELDLQEYCSLLGSRTHTEVLDYFRKSDVFVLGCEIARSGDRDGIPNVLVESLAMGVPAVSTNVSALPEILIDGTTGLTVHPGDSEGFAGAIMSLLNNEALRRRLIAEGQKYVRTHFDNKQLITRLAAVFEAEYPSLILGREQVGA